MIRTLVPALLLLTAAAPSPIALRNDARTAMQAERWADAAALYEELVAMSPDDGAVWRALGAARLRLARHDDAIAAFDRARAAGTAPAVCLYDTACAHALAGRRDAALAALRDAYAAGFANEDLVPHDHDLDSLREDPRFREIAGFPDPAVTDRTARWSRDLDFLARRIREVHWRPFGVLPEARFESALAALRASIPRASDVELRAGIRRLLASLGDGHTALVSNVHRLYHVGAAANPRFLPLELFRAGDGVRIAAATAAHRDLLGGRVTRIGDVDVETVIARVDSSVSRDNAWGARHGVVRAAADPDVLEELGLGDASRGYAFEVTRTDGSRGKVVLGAGGVEALDRHRLADLSGAPPPLRYREREQPLWMHSLGPALYVRIDAVLDTHEETLEHFTDRVFAAAEDTGARALLLDLRNNPGGQGRLWRPLLHRLIASETFNRPGGLYVLVGRETFSAAMALAAQLETHTAARFVGEPTGSRPNFVGETTLVTLPYSRLLLSISSRYHQNGDSDDRRLWIPPDIPAAPDLEAERAGRDPAVDAVLREIAAAG